MQKMLDDGFVIYMSSASGKLQGIGLKKLDCNRGMYCKEITEQQMNLFYNFPSLKQDLEEGSRIIQIYRMEGYGPGYLAQIGFVQKEGPYGEDECFYVNSECAAFDFLDALIGLEEQMAYQEKDEPLKKTYRLYGMDKFVTCNFKNLKKR